MSNRLVHGVIAEEGGGRLVDVQEAAVGGEDEDDLRNVFEDLGNCVEGAVVSHLTTS